MVENIVSTYWLGSKPFEVIPFGTGLINNTWKVVEGNNKYILQRINQQVFARPTDIAYNIQLVGDLLKTDYPNYLFVAPVPSLSGQQMIYDEPAGYFRMFPFIQGSFTIDVVENEQQAYEAAAQFGQFTRLLSHLDTSKLQITIPHFHDLALRYQQFLAALDHGNRERIDSCRELINLVLGYVSIVAEFEKISANPDFKHRVTHHDTKISNVLFGKPCNGLCVIDLDTIMPGYFISDVGDMMRTYLSPVSEEEKDVDKIYIREDIYKAIVDGYFKEMAGELTETEVAHFFYAGAYMIYMQALRFLTDYISGDIYYGEKYKGHNLVRAQNQMVLLQRLMEKEQVLKNYGPTAANNL